MRITDEQVRTMKRDGFVVIPNFLTRAEQQAALQGAFECVGPPYEQWLRERKNNTSKHDFFPWDNSALNLLTAHPDLIDAAERIMGVRQVRLRTGYVMVKYSTEYFEHGMHTDFANNTLGPFQAPDDFQHLSFFYYLDDVPAGKAPIVMVPNGQPDSAAVPIVAPAGSLCIYSMYTRHSSSAFNVTGHRVSMWVNVSRQDRLWDNALNFTVTTPQHLKGMERFIGEASPRQLEFLGFPPPGDPLWTDKFLAGMQARYSGFNPAPYRDRAEARETRREALVR